MSEGWPVATPDCAVSESFTAETVVSLSALAGFPCLPVKRESKLQLLADVLKPLLITILTCQTGFNLKSASYSRMWS